MNAKVSVTRGRLTFPFWDEARSSQDCMAVPYCWLSRKSGQGCTGCIAQRMTATWRRRRYQEDTAERQLPPESNSTRQCTACSSTYPWRPGTCRRRTTCTHQIATCWRRSPQDMASAWCCLWLKRSLWRGVSGGVRLALSGSASRGSDCMPVAIICSRKSHSGWAKALLALYLDRRRRSRRRLQDPYGWSRFLRGKAVERLSPLGKRRLLRTAQAQSLRVCRIRPRCIRPRTPKRIAPRRLGSLQTSP